MPSIPLRRVLLVSLGLLLVPLSAGRGSDDLTRRIHAVINGPNYRHARWGLLVVDADSGKTVFEHNADMLFPPASVTKLFTCAAALAEFGADYRFRTPVYRRGKLIDGTLIGDLILVAKGDPTLGGRTDANGHLVFKDNDHTYATFVSTQAELTDTDPLAGLRSLARQVRDSGIRKIEGGILIDDRLFPPSIGTGSGPKIVTPIIVNDNVVDVLISPGKTVGERAKATVRPQNDFIQVDVQVETVAKGEKPHISVNLVSLDRYMLRGRIALDSKPLVRICPVANPSLYARGLFIESLRREGIAVEASALSRPVVSLPDAEAYAGLTRVARLQSPPMSELLKVILKSSHNLYASSLPLLIATRHGKQTLSDGLAFEGKILKVMGVDVESISLESGAGGGSSDNVTPRVTVQLLRALARRPDYADIRDALPILGVDGTLATAVEKDSPARGKVRAKTGTYVDDDMLNDRLFLRSKSLAGEMTTKEGRHLIVALFVANVSLPRGVQATREGKILGHLCEILYEDTPGDEKENK